MINMVFLHNPKFVKKYDLTGQFSFWNKTLRSRVVIIPLYSQSLSYYTDLFKQDLGIPFFHPNWWTLACLYTSILYSIIHLLEWYLLMCSFFESLVCFLARICTFTSSLLILYNHPE